MYMESSKQSLKSLIFIISWCSETGTPETKRNQLLSDIIRIQELHYVTTLCSQHVSGYSTLTMGYKIRGDVCMFAH